MATLAHALRYAEQRARRGSLAIPSPLEVAADPSVLDRFLATYERLEAATASAREDEPSVMFVAHSHLGIPAEVIR